MGTYINIGNSGFQRARNGEYVDKSPLISIVNATLNTEHCMSCVTRCRRFGKSMAAKMLCAYYDHSCESLHLFEDLKIADDTSFKLHLNKYPVIYLDISDFVTRYKDETIIEHIKEEVKADIHAAYPDTPLYEKDDLMELLIRIVSTTGQQFIFIIDEWDAICREFTVGTKAMDDYVDWLRRLFKGGNTSKVFAGAYLTGILPIKKYKTESALNNFTEYSMVAPGKMATSFGFTKEEVTALAGKYSMDFDELEKWYDGYSIDDQSSIFNPNSVIKALYNNSCESYWASTGAYDAIASYISMNFDGLKDDILRLVGGDKVRVNTTRFLNDMSVIRSKDDVLTVMIHLGYLSYDRSQQKCYVPNYEVAGELSSAVEDTSWTSVIQSLQQSEDLLKAVLNGNADVVAKGVDAAHDENTSILSYHDENSLACVLSLAFYAARNNYIIHRELATGKGFADLVLIPRKHIDSPAIIIELKYNKDADTAIDQIKRKEYPAKVAHYADNLLLVGINYDRDTKRHDCQIEAYKDYHSV